MTIRFNPESLNPALLTRPQQAANPAADLIRTAGLYIAATGETLQSIAQSRLGDPNLARALELLNPALVGRALEDGASVRLPAQGLGAWEGVTTQAGSLWEGTAPNSAPGLLGKPVTGGLWEGTPLPADPSLSTGLNTLRNLANTGALLAQAQTQLMQAADALGSVFHTLNQFGLGQNPYVQGLANQLTQAFQGWQQQLNTLSNQLVQDFALSLISQSLGKNPTFQGLANGLKQAQSLWKQGLPKNGLGGLNLNALLQGLKQQLEPAALAQTLLSRMQGNPLQLMRGLGFNPNTLKGLANLPQIANFLKLDSLARNGVDVQGLLARGLDTNGISQLADLLGGKGLSGLNVGNVLNQLAGGGNLGQALQGLGLPNAQNLLDDLRDLKDLDAKEVWEKVKEKLPEDVTLAQGTFNFNPVLWQAQGSWGQPGGPLFAEGSIKVGEVSARGGGRAYANLRQLSLGAEGHLEAAVYALNAQGQVQANYGIGSTRAAGYLQVGAQGTANGSIKFDPLKGTAAAHIGGEAFAGVKAGVNLQQTLGPVGVDVGAKGLAGIGAKFELDVGFQNGKFNYKMDIGAALGIGFELNIGFSVDFKKIAQGVANFLKAPGKVLNDLFKGAADAVGWIGKAGGKVVNAVAEGAKKVGDTIADGAKKVGNAIADGAKAVGSTVKKIFSGW